MCNEIDVYSCICRHEANSLNITLLVEHFQLNLQGNEERERKRAKKWRIKQQQQPSSQIVIELLKCAIVVTSQNEFIRASYCTM